MRLILFDIDNTLLYTGGAGGLGMNLAFQEMFGISDGFASVEFSGRTDLFILSEALRRSQPATRQRQDERTKTNTPL